MTTAGVSNESEILEVAGPVRELAAEVGRVVVGQDKMVRALLIGVLTGGHVLLEGVPGLAKTLTVTTMARAMHAKFSRIQFTPDLLPADLIGTLIYDPKNGGFTARKGPIFANLVLADEINRAPAKVQSALLEAMQERAATIGDTTYPVGDPFLVLATQNPIEQEGTYPLPEAQLDRFLLQIDVDYPDRDTERAILLATTGVEQGRAHAVFDAEGLVAAQALIRRMPVGETVLDAILDLVRAARPGAPEAPGWIADTLVWGPGPRAAQALTLVTRARAALNGRFAPTLDDVEAMAAPVLRHRMALSFAARARGETIEGVIARLLGDRMRAAA